MKVLTFGEDSEILLLNSTKISYSKNLYGNIITISNNDSGQTIKSIYDEFIRNSNISCNLFGNIIFNINYDIKKSTINYTTNTNEYFYELIDIFIPNN